ncbi:lytic murein transglycosylase [Methylobacterium sp. J-068]|uniref:lytic murein transglycosylase n=1 Tax=Methylobacterium sp. J-068 TaxID=2836649 RepID=UPI001FB9E663|nr:lytic murein transglycosylase [Methylobacterium sp. J-068]MCJ2033429.1 lytic murein transglycosylase [Methylobacterium sp. J-068]
MRCRRRSLRPIARILVLALAMPALSAARAETAGSNPPSVPTAPAASNPPDPGRAECLGAIAREARERGVPEAVAARLADVAPDPDVVAATRNQAEFVKPIWSYLDANLTEARIEAGRAKLRDWAPTLAAIEARYGVDRHVLVAFWGVESTYGSVLDDPGIVRPVLRSLATLACSEGPRAPYWRGELVAALQIMAQDPPPPEPLTGSWAGAMGHTQFMPTVYRAYAVDFDGDGRRDIWNSVPDALASTANYLRDMGWRPGERWGSEARLPEGFDYALADETTERSLAAWRALGVESRDASTDETVRATLIVPAGARGPAFLLQPNFRMILRYNTALSYALTVAHLSDRLRGAPAFARDWPRGDAMLSAEALKGLQGRLAELGFSPGAADGKPGPRTRAAIRAYQAARGLTPDGYVDAALAERIGAVP